MSKEIKDYLKFYLGCEAMVDMRRYLGKSIGKNVDLSAVLMRFDAVNRNTDIDQCWGVSTELPDGIRYFNCFDELCVVYSEFVHSINIKPILRDLSDMTEEEREELWHMQLGPVEIRGEITNGHTVFFDVTPSHVSYLLSKGFDLFGLIPAGLAINAKDLKQ